MSRTVIITVPFRAIRSHGLDKVQWAKAVIAHFMAALGVRETVEQAGKTVRMPNALVLKSCAVRSGAAAARQRKEYGQIKSRG
jgi:hypothetical protein